MKMEIESWRAERKSKGIRVSPGGGAINQAEVYDGKKAYEDTR